MNLKQKHLGFSLFVVLAAVLFLGPLISLVGFSLHHEQYSHTVLIPLISGYLLFLERKRIFSGSSWEGRALGPAIGFALVGLVLYLVARRFAPALNENDYLSLTIFSLVTVWVAGFSFFYGRPTLRAAAFPLGFLVLMVPIPSFLLDKTIYFLQVGSADVTDVLFRLTGTPVFREGLVFSLPGVAIEIAKECSGIRSSMALLITCLLAGHLFLKSNWKRTVFCLAVVPVAVLKNGIRIVTLTLLSVYVDPGFLSGPLHRRGGAVFFVIALGIMGVLLLGLQKLEARSRGRLPAITDPSRG